MRVAHHLRPAPGERFLRRDGRCARRLLEEPHQRALQRDPRGGRDRDRRRRHRDHEHHADVGHRAHARESASANRWARRAATSASNSWPRRSCSSMLGGALGVIAGAVLAAVVACVTPLPARVTRVVGVPRARARRGRRGHLRHPPRGPRVAARSDRRDARRMRLRRSDPRERRDRPRHAAGQQAALGPHDARRGDRRVHRDDDGGDRGRASAIRSSTRSRSRVPTTFYVMKFFSQTPLNPDRLPKYVRIRPDLVEAEAERVAQLPEIEYAGDLGAALRQAGVPVRTARRRSPSSAPTIGTARSRAAN